MRETQQASKTSSRLRSDIDAGKGRDKIAYPDPAAAPLGTDDEAAGTPVTEMQAQCAHQNEICDRSGQNMDGDKNNSLGPKSRAGQGRSDSKPPKPRLGPLILGLALLVLILLAASLFA